MKITLGKSALYHNNCRPKRKCQYFIDDYEVVYLCAPRETVCIDTLTAHVF